MTAPDTFEYYASLASDFPFEERAEPSFGGGYGMIVREPVGVVGAIIPWNAPLPLLRPQGRARCWPAAPSS